MSLPPAPAPPINQSLSNVTTPPATKSPLLPPTSGAIPSPPDHFGVGVGVGIGGAAVLVLVCLFVFWYKRRERLRFSFANNPVGINDRNAQLTSSTNSKRQNLNINFANKKVFTCEELANATQGFSDENFLGKGGFGRVYKGVLPDDEIVAIKQLKADDEQGDLEFQAEVTIISRVHHKNLVSLVGYCKSGSQRMLVLEFVPNNTLDYHLHGNGKLLFMWNMRMKVAVGAAKGLAYLHEDCEPKIIHRDIKAANILLENNFEPKVADFGLAKFTSDSKSHISTRVMGTYGYLAPEYASTGVLTAKSDLFSFGVILLELITGFRPVDNAQFVDGNIVDWARPLLTKAMEDGDFSSLVDVDLQNNYDPTEMIRLITCAAACVRHSASKRPLMSQIVMALEGNLPLQVLDEYTKPEHKEKSKSTGSQDLDTAQYSQHLEVFQKMILGSQDSYICSSPTTNTTNFGDKHNHSDSSSNFYSAEPQDIEFETQNNFEEKKHTIGLIPNTSNIGEETISYESSVFFPQMRERLEKLRKMDRESEIKHSASSEFYTGDIGEEACANLSRVSSYSYLEKKERVENFRKSENKHSQSYASSEFYTSKTGEEASSSRNVAETRDLGSAGRHEIPFD